MRRLEDRPYYFSLQNNAALAKRGGTVPPNEPLKTWDDSEEDLATKCIVLYAVRRGCSGKEDPRTSAKLALVAVDSV